MTNDREAREAFAIACEHDRNGREAAAIPEYERALALGLDRDSRAEALLGLGSSLRNVDRSAESVEVLRAATSEYPDHPALRAFLGLALYSHGDSREAVVTLLDLVLAHAPVGHYGRSLGEYRDQLRRPTDPVDGVHQLARQLSRQEFQRSFDHPFLLGLTPAHAFSNDFSGEETETGRRDARSEPRRRDEGPLALLGLRKLNRALPSAITLGRSDSNDLVVRDTFVSKVHALFRHNSGRWELTDAGSRNGTWIGNDRLEPRGASLPLVNGDVLTIGRTAFFFLDSGACWDRLRAGQR